MEANHPRPAGADWKVWAGLMVIWWVWGSTYLAIRVAVETLPPLALAGARYTLSGLLIYGATRISGVPRPERSQWLAAMKAGALMFALGNGLVCISQQYVSSGLTALAMASSSPLMVLFGWVGGERPKASAILGLLIGMLGAALLAGPIGESHPLAFFALLTACSAWCVGTLLLRRSDMPASSLLATGMIQICGGALVMGIGTLLGEWGEVAGGEARSWWAMLYLVIFGSVLAGTVYTWLSRNASARMLATYPLVNPIVAVALGWALLGEPVTLETVIAGGMLLLGVGMIAL